MKKLISIAFSALAAMFASAGAQAGGISDNGINGYWGADGHGKGDVIGGSMYDIYGATVARAGSVLTFTIGTNFAGHAGADSWAATNGIGYGDLFLAQTWNPFGGDAHHNSDKAVNGTKWQYGLALNNRWSNTGGTFKLYQLNGGTNASNILNSESFMDCDLPGAVNTPDPSCTYRDGQATAVKTRNSNGTNNANVSYANVTGSWTVQSGQSIKFTFDAATTSLVNLTSFALHWGETCQNDVIEGVVSIVPTPGSIPLIALGMGMILVLRRRGAALNLR